MQWKTAHNRPVYAPPPVGRLRASLGCRYASTPRSALGRTVIATQICPPQRRYSRNVAGNKLQREAPGEPVGNLSRGNALALGPPRAIVTGNKVRGTRRSAFNPAGRPSLGSFQEMAVLLPVMNPVAPDGAIPGTSRIGWSAPCGHLVTPASPPQRGIMKHPAPPLAAPPRFQPSQPSRIL
jgi:hypothetical protein